MKHTITVGVFGIITNEQDEILFCHRNDYDLWNLPGGGLEKGETPWECIVREAKEETGLSVEVSRLMGIYAKPHKDEVVFMFVCNVIDGKLTLNEEARDLKYFALNQIPKNTVPKQVERLKHYFEDKDKVYLKEQGGKSSIDMVKEGNL